MSKRIFKTHSVEENEQVMVETAYMELPRGCVLRTIVTTKVPPAVGEELGVVASAPEPAVSTLWMPGITAEQFDPPPEPTAEELGRQPLQDEARAGKKG